MNIYSKRYSVAKGNHWVIEREVKEEDAQAWLNIFREDEPSIIFIACNKKEAKRLKYDGAKQKDCR